LLRRFGITVLFGLFTVMLAHAGNLVADPGFESCSDVGNTPPNWATSLNSVFCANFSSHSGTWEAVIASVGGTLSQNINTIIGDQYDFQFWLDGPGSGTTPSSFRASFGSDTVVSLTNSPGPGSYTLEDFTVTATATLTGIAFTGNTAGGAWALDDVSITDLGPATPEPSTLMLVLSALSLGFTASQRRRAR
jgi:hypothetical protein